MRNDQAKKAIARVITTDGKTIGTAFSVSGQGHLLTCWHVVHGVEQFQILFEGDSAPLNAQLDETLSNQDEDIAILKVARTTKDYVQFDLDWKIGSSVWTYGYQYQKIVVSGYPVQGILSGDTKTQSFRQLIVVSGTDFQKGLSGAPLFDLATGLVIGMVHGLLGEKGIGFAIPSRALIDGRPQILANVQQSNDKVIDNVSILFEILGYEVEKRKKFPELPDAGYVDLYGEMNIGFTKVRTVVACISKNKMIVPDDINDFVYKFCSPLYLQRRIENAFIVAVYNQEISEESLAFARSVGVRLVKVNELEANLINFSRFVTAYLNDYENHTQIALRERYPIIDQLSWIDLKNHYIDLNCRDLLKAKAKPRSLSETVTEWIQDTRKRFLAILGDYGSGKTSCCLQLMYNLAREYQTAPHLNIIPVYLPLRDCDPQLSLRTFILDKLSRYDIKVNSYHAFERMVTGGRLVLIFDGFDELASNTSEQIALKRFQEISSLATGKSKIILTCRTHYFVSLEDSINVLIPETLTPFMRELSQRDDYAVIELQELSYKQIQKLISTYKAAYSKAISSVTRIMRLIKSMYNLYDLAKRPILLAMILESIPELLNVRDQIDRASLYKIYMQRWLNRDKWRSVLSIEDKFRFAEELAWQMFANSKLSVHHEELKLRTVEHFRGKYTLIQITQTLDIDIRTCSFLNRDSTGYFTFTHKSFMEYLVAQRLFRNITSDEVEVLGRQLIPHTILNFIVEMMDKNAMATIKRVAIDFNTYSPSVRGVCMDIILLSGEVVTEVPWIFAVAFTAGDQVVTGSADGYVRIWRFFPDVSLLKSIKAHESWIYGIHSSENGRYLVTGGWDKCVKVWDLGESITKYSYELSDKIVSVAFSPEYKLFAAGGFDKAVHIWDFETGQLKLTLSEHYGVIWDVSFSPDLKYIATGCTDNLVRVWRLSDGKLKAKLRGHRDGVSCVCFSKDSALLFSGDWQGHISAWNLQTDKLVYSIDAHENMVNEIHVSPTQEFFASCGDDFTVKVWETTTGKLVHTFSDLRNFPPSMQFSNDGRFLACGSHEQILRIWDLSNWSLYATIAHTRLP